MGDQEMLFVRNGCEEATGSDEDDDVWDDTALIKAYDVAVKAVKDKIAQRLECNGMDPTDKALEIRGPKKNSASKNKKQEWQIGAACRAVYSEDGKIYEATIQSIDASKNNCIVRYVGYENEEIVPMSQLMLSEGPQARAIQEKESSYDISEGDIEVNNFHKNIRQTKNGKENVSKKTAESKRQYSKDSITNFGSQFPPLQLPPFFGQGSSNMSLPNLLPTSLPPPPPLSVTSSLPLGDSEALSAMLMSWYMSGFHTGYYQGLQQAKSLNGVAKQNP